MSTSWLMSLNKGDEKGTRFGALPVWVQEYLKVLRGQHKIQLQVYGVVSRKWGMYSMTAQLHEKDSYRLAGELHAGAVRTGFSGGATTYKYVFITDPKPLAENTVVCSIDGKAIQGDLIPY